MKEIWKDVVGYEEYFMISNFGEVWSKRTEKILIPTVTKTGYNTISTRLFGRWGGAKSIRIHRMVAEAFIPNPENKPFVNHLDGKKKNNDVRNLEWCTPSENTLHALKLGLLKIKYGKAAGGYFTFNEAEEIRKFREETGLSHRKIAKIYGASRTAITNILSNKNYIQESQ